MYEGMEMLIPLIWWLYIAYMYQIIIPYLMNITSIKNRKSKK
jgi:hypothetical protein